MSRIFIKAIFLLISFNAIGQTCPTLISPMNGDNNVSIDTSISWNKVEGVTGYIISIGTTPGGSDILTTQTSTNSYNPQLGLPDNTLVYVTVTLFFFNLPNIVCGSESFRTEDITVPPNCTRILNPANGDSGVNISSNITWEYVSGADGYLLTVGTTPSSGDLVNNLDVGNTLQYNPISDFLPLTEVFVKIVPYNENGNLISCVEESFFTGEIAALPNCSDIIFPKDGETNVPLSPLLEWEAVSGATGYKLFVGSSPIVNDVLDGISFFTNSTFVINFEPNTLYFIRIIPFNLSGEAIGCLQGSFSTVLGCGPFFDPVTNELTTLYPNITFPDQVGICENDFSTKIFADNTADGYRWYFINSNGSEDLISETNSVDLTESGTYRLEVYNTNLDSGGEIECSSSKEFTVVSSEAPRIVGVNVSQLMNGVEIQVQTSGNGDYEFSLDSLEGPFQDSNYFNNAPSNTSTIYVRDKNGCGSIKYEIINSAGFPKYFTPNGDRINDAWQFRTNDGGTVSIISLVIFDRFGRLIKDISNDVNGWDGTMNGNKLPSSDYWYKAIAENGTTFMGHFALKR